MRAGALMNKRVVVTGAKSGIGRAVADLPLERGVDLVCADLDERGMALLRSKGAEVLVGGNTA